MGTLHTSDQVTLDFHDSVFIYRVYAGFLSTGKVFISIYANVSHFASFMFNSAIVPGLNNNDNKKKP